MKSNAIKKSPIYFAMPLSHFTVPLPFSPQDPLHSHHSLQAQDDRVQLCGHAAATGETRQDAALQPQVSPAAQRLRLGATPAPERRRTEVISSRGREQTQNHPAAHVSEMRRAPGIAQGADCPPAHGPQGQELVQEVQDRV